MMKSEIKVPKAKCRTALGILLAAIATAATVNAATLTGVAMDAITRQPVPYAAVSAPNLDKNTIADSVGWFRLVLEAGLKHVTIVVSRVGYEEKRSERVDVSRLVTFYLRPNPVRMEGISVSAFRSPTRIEQSGPVSVIERRNAPTNGRLSLAELLWVSPSVLSKDYGNLATIGLRGANAEQTLILLDGVKLNSAQDNLFDLTTLPLTMAQRIEVVRGNSSALYGANSIGGLVNVITPEPDRFGVKATAGVGSFGKRYLQAAHSNWSDPLGYVVAASLNRTGDSFSYRNTSDSVHRRVNSDINSQDVMAKGVFAQGPHRVSLLGEYNVTRRGEPGPTFWPADSARMDDYRGIAHLSYDLQEADNARLESRLYRHLSWRHYWNPDTLSWVNDTHVTTVSGAMLKQTAHLAPWATAIVGLEGGREQFRSTAVGAPLRLTGSGWAEARLKWLTIDIIPMARFDLLSETKPAPDSTLLHSTTRVLSPKLSAVHTGPYWLSLYASAGRSFRAPTFNERYWPADPWTSGNPQLRPEWATSVDLGASARYRSLLTGRLGLWHTFLTDLIQWQPDSAYVFRPVNLDTATITGGELELGVSSRHVSVVGHATYMVARSHGKDLIYRPRLNLAVSHQLKWELVQLNWDVRRTGERYTNPDNTDSLPSFLLFDVGVGLTPTLGRLATALRGGIRNLFDKRYEVMKGYPIPGRNWYAELELRL